GSLGCPTWRSPRSTIRSTTRSVTRGRPRISHRHRGGTMSTGTNDPDRPVTRGPQDRSARADRAPAGTGAPAPGSPGGDTARDGAAGSPPGTGPADGATTPTTGAERPAAPGTDTRGGGATAGVWISLILGAIVLALLLIFVIQNNVTATFQYFTATFELPLGVAMLLAAIAGALVMALVGSVRMIQMSWTIRRLRKTQDKIQ